MHSCHLLRWTRRIGLALALVVASTATAHAHYGSGGSPNFDGAGWTSLACDNPDLIFETSPPEVNFVGDVAHSPAYFAYDSSYLYFRFRMDKNPYDGCGGYAKFSWTTLLTVPSGERGEFQYQLSFNGKTRTIELWHNTTASPIVLDPLFVDDSEAKIFSVFAYKLARAKSAGTQYNGTPDYFVDFAIPVSKLIEKGVIASAADLGMTSFFPATATRANNHDKGHLNCPFMPEIECVQPSDCDDDNACTTETCVAGSCGHTTIADCEPCTVAADCDDADPCTTEVCSAGACEHASAESCATCAGDADCQDTNPCTTGVCGGDGSCQLTTVAGCRTCENDAGCNDGRSCTADSCVDGVCQNLAIADCGEVCDNGTDDDGDGAVDCADPDCSGSANCPVEQCGDCTDNDGDGLIDAEDPDCCGQTETLILRRMRMRMAGPASDRLRLRTRVAAHDRLGTDPYRDGAYLQISDETGQIFCQEIPMQLVSHKPKRTIFKFIDKTGRKAAGLRRAKLRMRKNGSVMFRTIGKTMSLRTPNSVDLQITLRVGQECMQAAAPLRTLGKGHMMVFP